MIDWLSIKTEYITTRTSYRKLAEKYGLSSTQINRVGKEEGWVELRQQFVDKTVADSVKKISSKRSSKAARIDSAADRLIEKLEKAIGELDLKVITHKVKTEIGNTETTVEYRVAEEGGIVDRAGLRQLTAALKDLKEIKGILSELDKQEKKARIENLRRQTEKDDSHPAITVTIEGAADYAE